MSDIKVECCQRNCRHKHMESERARKPHKKHSFMSVMVCPKCGCDCYYKLDQEPSVAAGSETK